MIVSEHDTRHGRNVASMSARLGSWRRCLASVIVVVAICACEGAWSGDTESSDSDTGSSSAGTEMPEEGDACGEQDPQCAEDDNELFVCDSNVWAVESCTSICKGFMPAMCSLGCLHGQEGDECLCVPEGPECAGSQCEGNFLNVFPENTKKSCASICAEQGREIVLGCGFDLEAGSDRCQCVDADTACEDGTPSTCTGEPVVPALGSSEDIASCEDGLWVIQSCLEVCGFEATGCLESADLGAICVCE